MLESNIIDANNKIFVRNYYIINPSLDILNTFNEPLIK